MKLFRVVKFLILFSDYQKAQGRRAGSMRSRGSISGCGSPRVVLYAATNLFPLSRNLAEKYVINADNPVGEFLDHHSYQQSH